MANIRQYEVPQPDAPNLDLSVAGVVITAVVVDGGSMEILLRGGSGRWVADGVDVAVEHMTEGQMSVHYSGVSDAALVATQNRLERWRDDATTLRLYSAIDSPIIVLHASDEDWWPFPRRTKPEVMS